MKKALLRRIGLVLIMLLLLPLSVVWAEEINPAEGSAAAGDNPTQMEAPTAPEENIAPDPTAATENNALALPSTLDVKEDNAKAFDDLKVTELADARYRITGTARNLSAGDKIEFAVWSETGGQDDLHWYQAKAGANGEYSYDLSLKDHKHLGLFNLHVYSKDKNQKGTGLKATTFTTKLPSVPDGGIVTKNYNEKTGNFTVTVSGIENPELVTEILVPIWSAEKQANIVWHQAQKTGADSYTLNVKLKDHRYLTGEYHVHVYGKNITGDLTFLGDTKQMAAATPGTLTLSAKSNSLYQANLKGGAVPGGMSGYNIAVWSDDRGQDDLRWYWVPTTTGSANLNIPLENHKSLGDYHVHIYAKNAAQQSVMVNFGSFNVAKPAIGKISVSDINKSQGTFTIDVTGVTNEGAVKGIDVPTWCANDQSDIVWYQAKRIAEGHYQVKAKVANHKYHMGDYKIHVYLKDIVGGYQYVGNTAANMPPTVGSLKAEAKSDGTAYQASIDGVSLPGGVRSVLFAVWSDVDGQNDIRWYPGKKSGNTYNYDIALKNHKSYGKYHVHAYGTNTKSELVYLGAVNFDAQPPVLGTPTITSQNKSLGTYTVKVPVVSGGAGITEVLIPTWSQEKQRDIVWHTAKRQGDGSYQFTVNIASHRSNVGIYTSHVYVRDIREALSFVPGGNLSCDLRPAIGELTTRDTGNEMSFEITAKDLVVPGGYKSIHYAVWSQKNGQDDLRWYKASSLLGTHRYTVPINNHKTLGHYYVHVYAERSNGAMTGVGATSFNVGQTPSASGISVDGHNRTSGTFRVRLSGISAAAGVESVRIPVWRDANQNDIVWYSASRQGDGSYVANVQAAKHKHHFGTFQIHAYVKMKNGIETMVQHTTTNLSPLNYVFSEELSFGRYRVNILNPNDNNVTSIRFPTWSETNGQDDLVWYGSTNMGGGRWGAEVSARNHRHGGTFITHVYGTTGGREIGLGGMSYYVPPAAVRPDIPAPTCIIIDINSQMMRYYINYTLVVETPVTTGQAGRWDTPRGTYYLYGKSRNVTLSGPGYASFVSFWMPFYQDYGIHDATWRSNFGGNVYTYNGSHGCVNTPYHNAQAIYNSVSVGTMVVVR